MYFTDIEVKINEAFHDIFSNPLFMQRGFKKYRILFFTFLFGNISAHEMIYIFEDSKTDILMSGKNEDNANRAILRYFLKPDHEAPLLKKEGKFFRITSNGCKTLWEFLGLRYRWKQEDKERFLNHRRVRLDNYKHGSTTAITTLLLFQQMKFQFFIEPAFICGERKYLSPGVSACRPDAVYETPIYRIFLETDLGTEGRAAWLNKLQRYVCHILSYESISADKTNCILISILLPSMEKVLDRINNLSLEFEEVIKDYKKYRMLYPEYTDTFGRFLNRYRIAYPEKNFIKTLPPVLDDSSFTSMKAQLIGGWITLLFTKQFLVRRRLLIDIIMEIPSFLRSIDKGLSVFVIPTHYLCQKVIQEIDKGVQTLSERYVLSYLRGKYPLCEIQRDFSPREVVDDISGQVFVFPNVYQMTERNGPSRSIIIDNISLDIGAYIRIQRLCQNRRQIVDDNIVILCCYFDGFDTEFISNYNCKFNENSNIIFMKIPEKFL